MTSKQTFEKEIVYRFVADNTFTATVTINEEEDIILAHPAYDDVDFICNINDLPILIKIFQTILKG